MKKLLKIYGFNTIEEYFQMIEDSIVNGQRGQAKEQFKEMPRNERKSFCKQLLSSSDKDLFIDLI